MSPRTTSSCVVPVSAEPEKENDPCVRNAKRVDDVREEFVCVTGQMTDVAQVDSCVRMHESAHHAKKDDQCDTRDSGSDVEMYARPVVCAHERQLKGNDYCDESQRRESPVFFSCISLSHILCQRLSDLSEPSTGKTEKQPGRNHSCQNVSTVPSQCHGRFHASCEC